MIGRPPVPPDVYKRSNHQPDHAVQKTIGSNLENRFAPGMCPAGHEYVADSIFLLRGGEAKTGEIM
jgi:hypothetical protein